MICVTFVGLILFLMNHINTSRCSTHASSAQLDENIVALNRRLLQAESQVLIIPLSKLFTNSSVNTQIIRNSLLRESLLKLVQAKIQKVELQHLEELTHSSQDEAVRVALLLAEKHVNPVPEFDLNPKYFDAEVLADAISEVFKNVEHYDEVIKDSSSGKKVLREADRVEVETITDTEASRLCSQWQTNYHVVKGVSWGDLPYDLQQKWVHYSCDSHIEAPTLTDSTSATVTAPASINT